MRMTSGAEPCTPHVFISIIRFISTLLVGMDVCVVGFGGPLFRSCILRPKHLRCTCSLAIGTVYAYALEKSDRVRVTAVCRLVYQAPKIVSYNPLFYVHMDRFFTGSKNAQATRVSSYPPLRF
jgi:hypothetical protein